MSKKQCSDSTRSVSDGDLTSSENCNIRNGEVSDSVLKNTDKQVFFTLPRWMSGRKRSRSKIKYVKVDVPFTSDNDEESLVNPKLSNGKKGPERHGNFVSKLFRRSSFFSNSGSSKNNVKKHYPKVPVPQTISASNTDIRTNNVVFYSFDFHEYFRDKIPAVCGIKNHGNTCFMNAVIQCLSNTDTFAEYFVMGHYKMDFLRRNKVHSKKYGTRGEVTEQLAVLLKSLWSCQYYTNISNKFKNLVAKYGSQYEGSEQHDAQEFLLWLLDKVHEDLNTAPKQKYKKPKGSYGRTDEEIAAEMLANHLRCNSSFAHDLFQGQIRSSLCCLGCGRFSNTFDPYLCISLPIPQHQTTQLFLHLVYLNVELKMIKVGVLIDSQATVSDLFEKLSSNFGLPPQNIVLTEIIDGEFLRNFKESDPISSFKDSECIFAIETPPSQPSFSRTIEQEKILLIVACCMRIDDTECELFWKPFALEIFREISYKDLQLQILDAISPVLKGSVDLETESPFCLFVVDGDPTYELLCSSVDLPLYMPVIDQALMLHDEKGIKHLKLVLECHRDAEYLLRKDLSFSENHPSVAEMKAAQKASNDVSLYECFDAYFNEEKLGVDDAWMCPCCRHRLPSVKQLSLWTVPDILIVHLKRFRQSSNQRTKMTTFVKFPSTGLDLQQYIATRSHPVQPPSQNSLAFWSPWKRSRSNPYSKSEEHVYDLFAVCNHHGTMQGGHYTACCRNPINGHWYLFDDTNVQEVQASELISTDAYILFYQRSSLSALSCASSSSSGYSSASSNYSVGLDHWAFRMPLPYRDVPITSKSQDNLYDVGNTASLDRRITSRPFHRTSRSYSTMSHFNDEKSMCSTVPRSVYEAPSYVDSYSYKDEIPPPPPPSTKHYWTVTSV